jgi:hypothetical protein
MRWLVPKKSGPRKDNDNENDDEKNPEVELVGFLGVGLDNQDEHVRMTTSDHFVLYGGSQETHEQMVDTAIHFEESLRKRGKTLQEASAEEIVDLLRRASDR